VSNSDDQNQSDDLAEERPIGVEEQRTIESQERETEPAQTQAEEQLETKEPETTTSVAQVNEILESSKEKQPKARQEDSTRKLFNQFSKHFQISKIASDKTANTLKQIQGQLTQIEKITSIGNKQQDIRQAIRTAAPEATETINYQIPTFKLNGNLVHFTAYKNHIGFYRTASGIKAFKKELSTYKWSKGAVQFPLDRPIPFDLIKRIVAFRVQENLKK
jgi:uncharacterized protein YdhG (YjbR/CyaY superfamily)